MPKGHISFNIPFSCRICHISLKCNPEFYWYQNLGSNEEVNINWNWLVYPKAKCLQINKTNMLSKKLRTNDLA